MPTARNHLPVASALPEAAPSGADTSLTIPTKAKGSAENWERSVHQVLMDWTSRPELVADEGIDPPTTQVLQKAVQLARQLQTLDAPAPDSLTPDPNGGIVFAWRENDVLEEYHIWDDGAVEYRKFLGSRLVERRAG